MQFSGGSSRTRRVASDKASCKKEAKLVNRHIQHVSANDKLKKAIHDN
jgi:hypothetical protein